MGALFYSGFLVKSLKDFLQSSKHFNYKYRIVVVLIFNTVD